MEERNLTAKEEAILAKAKPQTEAEAVEILAAAKNKSKKSPKKRKKKVKECQTCGNWVSLVCQVAGIATSPQGHCSNWSK